MEAQDRSHIAVPDEPDEPTPRKRQRSSETRPIHRLAAASGGALQTVMAAVLSATIVSSMLNYLWFEPGRMERQWKESALERIIAPVNMNMRRSTLAYEQYRSKHLYFQASILFETNKQVREVLLTQSHLLPNELRDAAACLVAHYDMWMLRYHLTLQSRPWLPDDQFEMAFHDISDGRCSQFPVEARDKFVAFEERLRRDLGRQ